MTTYYRKINHSAARARFLKGQEVVLCSKQFIPNATWHPQCHVAGYDKTSVRDCTYTPEQAWTCLKNSFNYHKCYDGDAHYGIDYYVALEK